MKRLDFVCEGEITPRIQLLLDYLEEIGVDLKQHTHPPKIPSEPYLLVPKEKDSKYADNVPGNQSIAIYLDGHTQHVPASYHFPITAWPARSCDPEVRRLAKFLRNPGSSFPTIASTKSFSSNSSVSSNQPIGSHSTIAQSSPQRQERVVLLGFELIALIFVGWLASSDSSDPSELSEYAEDTVELSNPDLDPDAASIEPNVAQPNLKKQDSPEPVQFMHQQETSEATGKPTFEIETDLNDLFAKQALDHQYVCQIVDQAKKPESQLQAGDANTIANRSSRS